MKHISIMFLLVMMTLFSCNDARQAALNRLLQQDTGKADAQTLADLKAGLDEYQKEADRTIKATEKIGVYYRLIAQKYYDEGMFGEALAAYEKALKYYPENSIIHALAAASASVMAKSIEPVKPERAQFFTTAEFHYQRAIALDPKNLDALYALSILYVYELKRPSEAIPLLERVLAVDTGNVDAMFVMGAANVLTGNIQKAVSWYDRIVETSKVADVRNQAAANRKALLESGLGK